MLSHDTLRAKRGYQITWIRAEIQDKKIHTCPPDDRHRLTGSLRVYGVDANRVRLILLQAINHMRGDVALQRLLIDHPRSVGWDN